MNIFKTLHSVKIHNDDYIIVGTTVNFSHLLYNKSKHVIEAISGRDYKSA